MTYTAKVYHGLTHDKMQDDFTGKDVKKLISKANAILEDMVEREVIAILDESGKVIWKRGFIGDTLVQYIELGD